MLTYEQCHKLATENPNHGSAVEGAEIEAWSRAYDRVNKHHPRIHSLAHDARKGCYDAHLAMIYWNPTADSMEFQYSADSGDPMLPGFKPNARHVIDADGRMMAAYYMERHWRREVFRVAGVPMPAELDEGLPDED